MENNYLLEITLMSAQGLKKTSKFRRMKTYAVASIDSTVKLRTCIDRVGGQNPTWNDRFLFRVSPEFLYSEMSGMTIEIFDDGVFRDTLVGTVRLLVGNILRNGSSHIAVRVPSFNAVQIRRPSGRFQGVLNVGASVLFSSDVPEMYGVSAINFRNLIEECPKSKIVQRSHSNLGIRHVHPPDSRGPIKERHMMVMEMGRTKHARSPSDGAIWGPGTVFSPKMASRSGRLVVGDNIDYRKPVSVRSKLGS